MSIVTLAGGADRMGKKAVARLWPQTVINLESARIVGGLRRISALVLSGLYFFTLYTSKGAGGLV